MAFGRAQCLAVIRDRLLSLNPAQVANTRLEPRPGYPAITYYSESETSETDGILLNRQRRVAQIAIHVWVLGVADRQKVESDLDEWAVKVGAALTLPVSTDPISVGVLEPVGVSFEVDVENNSVHRVTLTYNFTYYTNVALIDNS